MYISLDAYRVFYYVAQYHSFTKAADMLYSNQPNVTRTIKNLEQSLGCPLFVRSSRSVQLTPEGEELFAHIAPAIAHIQAGEEAVLLHTSLKSGVISVGASEIALHHTLLPVLKEFRRLYPQVHLRIYNSTTPQAISSLRERIVDLAIVTTPLDPCEALVRKDLITFRDVAICGQAYSDLAHEPLTLKQLTAYPLVSLRKGTATYELYHSFFHDNGLTMSPDIEAATSNQIIPMVRSDLGIGFVPEHTAAEEVSAGGIHILQLQQPLPERSICLLKRKDLPLSIAARELEKMLLEHSALQGPTDDSVQDF